MFWLLLSRNKVFSKVCNLKTIIIHCLVTKERGPWRVGYRLQKRMWGKQLPLSFQCSLAGWWKGGKEVCWWIQDEKWAEQVLEGKWGWRGAGLQSPRAAGAELWEATERENSSESYWQSVLFQGKKSACLCHCLLCYFKCLRPVLRLVRFQILEYLFVFCSEGFWLCPGKWMFYITFSKGTSEVECQFLRKKLQF